jgi:hypothetical protein
LPVAEPRPRPQLHLVPKTKTEQWPYVMTNREQLIAVLKAINRTPKPATTLRIWHAAIAAIDFDTGMIAASAPELAGMAEVPPAEARRCLAVLAGLGALQRTARGRYRINPHVGWSGSQANREALASSTRPVLTLVPSTSTDDTTPQPA